MNADDRPRPDPGSPEAHWCHTIPEELPPRPLVLGLPRLVLEARVRMGPDATPEDVARELCYCGVETTPEAVRQVWDEGHAGV